MARNPRSPQQEVWRAKRLVQIANEMGKCEEELKPVGYALEDLASEAGLSASERSSIGAGICGAIGGIALWCLALVSLVGALIMITIGALVILGGGGHALSRINKALKELRRANDELEECLKKHGYSPPSVAPVKDPPVKELEIIKSLFYS